VVSALTTVAYAAKFAVKRAPEGIDYSVMPLEGQDRGASMGAAGETALAVVPE
jgi:hypothetical protein